MISFILFYLYLYLYINNILYSGIYSPPALGPSISVKYNNNVKYLDSGYPLTPQS